VPQASQPRPRNPSRIANKTKTERAQTNKHGSNITVPMYGMSAMQHVARITAQAAIADAIPSTIQNKQ